LGKLKRAPLLTVPLAGLLLLAACGGDNSGGSAATTASSAATTATTAGATTTAAGGSTTSAAAGGGSTVGGKDSLKGVCPDTVSIQTDWNPEGEHGHLYQMLGDNPSINADKKSVSGPLVDSKGNDTGVKFEVRSGGPAIGFQTVTAQMYLDPAITLGYVYTDEGVQFSKDQPTVEVFAPFEKNPQMIMWDPATYPNVNTIADLGKTDTKVLYFEGDTYMAYLTGTHILKKSQVDGSYDASRATSWPPTAR
jgi:hypothetical protein